MNPDRSQSRLGAIAHRPRAGKKLLATLLSALLGTTVLTACGDDSSGGGSGGGTTVTRLLTVTIGGDSGGGSVKANSGSITNCTKANSPCTDKYADGAVVTLTATTSAGYTFSGWSGGDCSGTASNASVTMNSDRSCTATFSKNGEQQGQGTSTDQTIALADGTRHYQLYLPSTYNTAGKVFPLIVALHGDTGSGPDFEKDLGLDVIADAHGGAIIVYPTANADGTSGGAFVSWEAAANADFIDQVVTFLVAQGHVAPGRVFITGFSGGGSLINLIFSNGLTKTAWKAVVKHSSGGTSDLGVPEYPATVSIPSLHIHGQSDNRDFNPEGYGSWIDQDWYGIRDYWAVGNACSTTGVGAYTADGTWDPSVPWCTPLPDCNEPVIWCAIPGMGHRLWAPPFAGTNWAGHLTWQFFAEQP